MTTTLGSVPFSDPDEACRIMFDCFPEAPCVPRLGLSYRRYVDGMPCLRIDPEARRITFDPTATHELESFYEHYLNSDLDHFAMDPTESPGFESFLTFLERARLPRLKMVHVGILGPLTYSLTLTHHETGQPAWYDETMRDVVLRLLTMKARWHQKKILAARPGLKILLSVAEPSLGIVDSPFGSISITEVLEVIDRLFAGVDCIGEVHCCSNTDWGLLMRTRAQVINFDAYRYADRIALYPADLQEFLGSGGILAWGIVPVNPDTVPSATPTRLMARLDKGMDALVATGIDRQLLLEQTIITPCCDAGTLSPVLTEQVWNLTREIGASFRERYFPEADSPEKTLDFRKP